MTRRTGLTAIAVAICGLAVCAGLAFARGKTFTNSGFERNSFQGWQHKQEGDSGRFVVYKGTPDLLSFFPDLGPRGLSGPQLRKPRRGKYAAASVQEGPGTRILTRTLNLKPNTKRKLAFVFSYENFAGDFVNPTPDTLHTDQTPPLPPRRAYGVDGVSRGISVDGNQQYRIDVIRKSAGTYSIKSSDILKRLLASKAGDDAAQGWKRYTFNLSSLPAGKAKVRLAEADTNGSLVAYFDALKLTQDPK